MFGMTYKDSMWAGLGCIAVGGVGGWPLLLGAGAVLCVLPLFHALSR